MKTWGLCVIAFAFCLCARATEISPEARQCFDWFSTLGYPDLKDARWAEISTGIIYGDINGTHTQTTTGFVFSESPTDFQMMSLGLVEQTFTKSGPEVPAAQRVAFEERSFLEMAKTMLSNIQHPPKDRLSRLNMPSYGGVDLFLIAYACWRKSEPELAQQFFDEDAKTPGNQYPEAGKMRGNLERYYGDAAIVDTMLRSEGPRVFGALGDPTPGHGAPRAELLERFRKILRLYPTSYNIEVARDAIPTLEEMVQEDIRHKTPNPEEFAKLPLEKQVEELIFSLRDQHGYHLNQYQCLFFLPALSGDLNTAADKLAKIGYPAVPQLIHALGDRRFCRAKGHGVTLMTVGDCAEAILERIAGEDFRELSRDPGDQREETKVIREERMTKAGNAAKEWWRKGQKEGEKNVLIAALSAGNSDPYPLATKLRERFPGAIEGALIDGERNSKAEWIVRNYLELLGKQKSKAATNQLLEAMKSDGKVSIRMAAARELIEQDNPAALPAAIDEWKRIPPAGPRRRSAGVEPVLDVLLPTGSTEAISAVVKNWNQRNVYDRFTIVEKLGEWMHKETAHWGSTPGVKPAGKDARSLAVALLVHALEDTDYYDGMASSLFGSDPRICDAALWALHALEPEIYAFSHEANRRQRDFERMLADNQWRRAHGQAEIPMPDIHPPKLTPEDALQIVGINADSAGVKRNSEFTEMITKLKGTIFTADTIPSLVLWFARNEMAGFHGIRVEAVRDADLTGVHLAINLLPGIYPVSGDWTIRQGGWIGDSMPVAAPVAITCPLSDSQKQWRWAGFTSNTKEGLNSPPATKFVIRADLVASQ